MCEIGNAPGKGRVGGMITASDYEHREGEAGLPLVFLLAPPGEFECRMQQFRLHILMSKKKSGSG